MRENRLGSIAAWVAAAGYTIAAVILAIATTMSDNNPDNDPAVGWISFWILVAAASIAVAVVAYTLHRQVRGVLILIGLVVTVIAMLGAAVVPWAWLIWGVVLSVGFLLIALGLRRNDNGVAGAPSGWDWVIPAVGPLGLVVTLVLWNTEVVEENPNDLDWGYSGGFIIVALGIAATMAQIARSLSTPVPAVSQSETGL